MAFPKLMAGHRIRFQQLPRERFSGTKGEKRSQPKSRQIRNFFGLDLKPEATTQVDSKTAPRLPIPLFSSLSHCHSLDEL